jgi:hypothetical protein
LIHEALVCVTRVASRHSKPLTPTLHSSLHTHRYALSLSHTGFHRRPSTTHVPPQTALRTRNCHGHTAATCHVTCPRHQQTRTLFYSLITSLLTCPYPPCLQVFVECVLYRMFSIKNEFSTDAAIRSALRRWRLWIYGGRDRKFFFCENKYSLYIQATVSLD